MSNSERITIAYIGGGSVNFGWELISSLSDEEITAQVNLYDIDRTLCLANEVIGNKLREVKNCRGDIIYVASEKPEEALRGADYVILSISCGEPEETVSQLHLPESYGIYQSCGESSGPAAVIQALKVLPIYIKYAELIKKCCPNAWVLTLTNPMAECLMTLKKAFPEIKAVGISGDVSETRTFIAGLAAVESGAATYRRRDVKTNLLGISGFSWYNELSSGGEDLMPLFRRFAEKYSESGFEFREGESRNDPKADGSKIRFDLFLRYGLVPAVPDRIIADYFGTWYLKTPKILASWKQAQTTANHLKKQRLERMSRVKPLMNGTEILEENSLTETAQIIRALMGMGNFITNAVMLNEGQVDNLPRGAAVETNALVSRGSIRAVAAGSLTDELAGMSVRSITNRALIVRSVFEKDLDIAFNAFLNDPLMSIDLNSAAVLYKDMLASVRNSLIIDGEFYYSD